MYASSQLVHGFMSPNGLIWTLKNPNINLAINLKLLHLSF